MTDAERKHLAAILGMLGSQHHGERDAAALQAEAFRRRHNLTWEEVLSQVVPAEPRPLGARPDEWPLQEPRHEPILWRKVVLMAAFWWTILMGALAVH